MNVIYKDSADGITIEQCLDCQAAGIAVIVDEGSHVTFEIEMTGNGERVIHGQGNSEVIEIKSWLRLQVERPC